MHGQAGVPHHPNNTYPNNAPITHAPITHALGLLQPAAAADPHRYYAAVTPLLSRYLACIEALIRLDKRKQNPSS